MKTIESLLDECRPYMIDQCLEACDVKLHAGHSLKAMSDKEKDVYEVEGWEDLSSAVFYLLYSGFGGFARNYVAKYNVNRLLVGFDNINQLVHFADFIIQLYGEVNGGGDKEELQGLIDEAKNLTADERIIKYTVYNNIYNSLKENPFPPNRMELLSLLKRYKNLDVEIESRLSLWLFIGPIYEALNNIDSAIVDSSRMNFEPKKESPTNEGTVGVTVIRNRF